MALSQQITAALLGNRVQSFLSDGIYDVLFDSMISFTESDNSTVSRHTIEDGADITDNINSTPKKINLSVVMTDDDWDILNPFSFINETMEDRFETLEFWKITKPILTYFGHETDIEDVVLTGVTKNKNLDVGAGWGLDISLERVEIASFFVVAISLSTARAKGATSKGTANKAGSAAASKNKSILSSLL